MRLPFRVMVHLKARLAPNMAGGPPAPSPFLKQLYGTLAPHLAIRKWSASMLFYMKMYLPILITGGIVTAGYALWRVSSRGGISPRPSNARGVRG